MHNNTDPKFRRFVNLQGHLQKMSTNILIGFQHKYWKVLDNGTKIGYANTMNQPIKAQNTFLIKQCSASESSGNTVFQLQTRNRMFLLRAPNQEQRTDWIKGITYLKKVQTNQIKLKSLISPTQTTVASRSQRLKPKNNQSIQRRVSHTANKPRIFHPQDLMADKSIQSSLISQLIKYLPQKCLKYYTLLTNLKIKSQGLFLDSFDSHTYLLISPKSLYPEIYIGQQNLSNLSLPPWLQINIFYRILNTNPNSKQNKQKNKQIFHINKIIDICQGSQSRSLKINTGQIIYQFFTQAIQQKQCVQSCLRHAVDNAYQVEINGRFTKKNFDKLIDLHQTKLQQFQEQTKNIVLSFLPKQIQIKYNPATLIQFMDLSMKFLTQFIQILQRKKKSKDHVISDMIKAFHQEVKTQAKLTWDSSFLTIKGVDILNILKKLSQYYQLMKNYIKSAQFLQGMKQLSKIYVRESWKNFQSIIINIVQQQKKGNIFQDQYCDYIQTNGVTDLFKFIYNVFDLAYPHWKNKIHLHNVNRLMQRALQVFINQIRSTIDQQVIAQKQMIGLANNYFLFNDYVKQFYTQKFQGLVQKTQQAYQKIISNYKEVSMIILQKIAARIGNIIQAYTQKCTIQTIKSQQIQQILYKQTQPLQKLLHMAFYKKLYQKLTKQAHIKICHILLQQTKNKKKIKLKQTIRCVKQLRTNLNKIFDNLNKNHTQIDKRMEEIQIMLSYDLYSDLEGVVSANVDPIKQIYLKILELREDFYQGSALYRIVNEQLVKNQDLQMSKSNTKRTVSPDSVLRERDTTMSKQYVQQQLMDSDENQNIDEKQKMQNSKKNTKGNQNQTQNKLISQGYLTKGKRNHKVWQKEYFRLKNGTLYIFQSEDSQRCRNAIQVKNITKIQVLNKEKPSFLLSYKNIGKQKQIKLKTDSIQLRQRWVNSIQLQRKRILNQQQVKKKTIKIKQVQPVNGRKKFMMIIDYEELEKGKDYFSYSA